MATVTPELQPTEEYKDKGLKGGALGLVASVTMGVASTAPAYSLAATLAFVVVLVGFHAPIIAVLAFVPIFLTSIGYSELNKADPDCCLLYTSSGRPGGAGSPPPRSASPRYSPSRPASARWNA